MSDAVKALMPALEALTAGEREELRDWLNSMEYVEGELEDLTPEQWAEIDRRLADVEAGRAELVPAEEVFRRLDAKYGSPTDDRRDAG